MTHRSLRRTLMTFSVLVMLLLPAVIAGPAVAQGLPEATCLPCAQVPVARLTDPLASVNDGYATSIAIGEDVAAIGVPGDDLVGIDAGSVMVYRQTGFGWEFVDRLILSSLAPGDAFGYDVDVDGDTIVIGAPGTDLPDDDAGCAYVFEDSITGWTLRAVLASREGATGNRFGHSVAIDGSLIAVGAPDEDGLCATEVGGMLTPCCNAGSVSLFRRASFDSVTDAGEWVHETTLRSPQPALGEGFGFSVDIVEADAADPVDIVLIGAPFDRHCTIVPTPGPIGSAYTSRYFDKRSGWTRPSRWEGHRAGDRFGTSVALNATRMLVGAPGDARPTGDGQDDVVSGVAYYAETLILGGSPDVVPANTVQIFDCEGADGDAFGSSVDLNGVEFLIGAPGSNDIGPDSGAVYAYIELISSITLAGRLISLNPAGQQRFGDTVAIGAEGGLIGAPTASGGLGTTVPNAGTAYDVQVLFEDCNQNGVNDLCDINDGDETDCNGNGIPDACEVLNGDVTDCNGNLVPDDCEDCNGNGFADECDIANGTSLDCNDNGVADECEDCNFNGLADACDIADGSSLDADANGIPDECECDCIDLVLAVDNTGSMNSAIANVKESLPSVIELALARSGNDLRLALVTFKDTVRVVNPLTSNVESVRTSVSNITTSGGAALPEASDQALRMILTGSAMCSFGSQTFDVPFRDECVKHIVLITDALPGGCDDAFVDDEDGVNAAELAQLAADEDVIISAVLVQTFAITQTLLDIMSDYAEITGGVYAALPGSGEGVDQALEDLLNICLDCNENGVVDLIDIASGTSEDLNGDGIPDECTSGSD